MIYISLLRGINVSGQKKIKMVELKSLYESMGFENVVTYIQSGNVIFTSQDKDKLKLANLISGEIRKLFGFDVSVFIRTKNEWEQLIKNNPFLVRQNLDRKRMYVTLFSQILPKIETEILDRAKFDSEEYAVGEKEIYFYCPEGYGRTKLSNNFMESKLRITATTRNWNTVTKLADMTDS